MQGQDVSCGYVRGPLSPHMAGYGIRLEDLGYRPTSAGALLRWAGRLSAWMADWGAGLEELGEPLVSGFIASWQVPGRVPGVRSFGTLLSLLRERGVIAPPAAVPPGPGDELLGRYRQWLVTERGLAERTVGRYMVTARRFLEQGAGGEPAGIAGIAGWLSGRQVTAFLLAEAGRGLAAGSVQGRVAELRSLLRFLHASGAVEAPLSGSVPPAGGWRGGTIPPRTPAAGDIAAMLASCDQGRPAGLRDFAILAVLARLGLRAGEVTALELGDIDWRAGEVIIRGKARREDRLPLPWDAGEAIAAYLSGARPAAGCRNVFLSARAPVQAMTPHGVANVVLSACRRAGLPVIRPHRLRHALAARLLRHGAALPEISQLLRHHDLATTAVYAKVDLDSLRQVTVPWTGAGR
jgi:integrase/recombinase XerD